MKSFPGLACMLVGSLAFLYFIPRPAHNYIDQAARKAFLDKKLQTVIGCTPDWSQMNIGQMADDMVPLPGSGSWQWKISTSSDSAQFYFNQGINLYYGFHIVESVPSFRKAQEFDPSCAILYWGEALALGPNINDVGYSATLEAQMAVAKADSLASKANAKEKALIAALLLRYNADARVKQPELNEKYAAAMRTVHTRFNQDGDAATLLADALMLLHPWDFWNHDGDPRSWTPEIVDLLEKVLAKTPNHPGANHYYIHAVEASPNPGRATASADRLGDLAPMLSHLTHMPSHIYVRTEAFEKGIAVNDRALAGYEAYKKLYPAVEQKADLYEIHNLHMQVACAINLDDYDRSLSIANKCRKSFSEEWMDIPLFGNYIQFIYMSPGFVMIQYKHWKEILVQPDIPRKYLYARILQAFSKGLALAGISDTTAARNQLQLMEEMVSDSSLALPIGAMNAPLSGASVALHLLKGAIAERTGSMEKAISFYQKAVSLEDAMIYNEPKDWLLPARHWLGNGLLANGQWTEAKKVFLKDLQVNPGNHFSREGLEMAAKMRKRSNF